MLYIEIEHILLQIVSNRFILCLVFQSLLNKKTNKIFCFFLGKGLSIFTHLI